MKEYLLILEETLHGVLVNQANQSFSFVFPRSILLSLY